MSEVLVTVEDLKARWLDFPPGQEEYAAVLLADAVQHIFDTIPDAKHAPAATIKRVACAMVRRVMTVENAQLLGQESASVTVGPFSQSWKASNPHGDFYLTAQERKALGVGRQRAFTIDITPTNRVGDERVSG